MAVDSIIRFFYACISLQSFPVFCFYLLMIGLAQHWQKMVKAVHLRSSMVIYNLIVSALNGYCFLGFIYSLLVCRHFYSKLPDENVKHFFFLYWSLKIIELLDTVFMILRHRQRQISFLHVYHHSSMILLTDYGYHYAPWPAITFPIMLNSFVHVCLYFYYGLSAYTLTIAVTWRKHMTQIQILQFFVALIHATIGYLYHGFCIYSIFFGLTMVGLFGNFYYIAYIKKRIHKSIIKKN